MDGADGAEAVAVVVVEATIHGGVSLTAPATVKVHARPGQEVRVLLRYHLEESSARRERYRVGMVSGVGDQVPPPVDVSHGDTWGHHDIRFGVLGHRYRFDGPGSYRGELVAFAAYHRGAWVGKTMALAAEDALRVPLEIEVGGAPKA